MSAFPTGHLAGRVHGLIASPPCQAFSAAGKGAGRRDLPLIHQALEVLADGGDPLVKANMRAVEDVRSLLVLEPVRWVRDVRPWWVALEQVPPVLPLWRRYAEVFAGWGYHCWTGVLNSANYGVPQTRERAILMASRGRRVAPPEPTHSDQRRGGSLLGLKPWVSMAEALGWGWDDTPARTVCGHCGPRWGYEAGETIGRVLVQTGNSTKGGTRPGGLTRSAGEPAHTVDSRVGQWTLHTNRDQRPDGSRQVVESDRPAPMLTGKSGGQWTLSTIFHNRGYDRSIPRTLDQPASTLSFGHAAASWAFTRPADEPQRITVEQAAVLQGFPHDYPFAGNKTQRFQQIGDAFPPPVAAAVIRALTGGAS